MSINKKALTRYLAYDKCLRNPGKHSWKTLVNKANEALENEAMDGIGKTQFYADMQYMEFSAWEAPIERYKEGRNVYFRYSDKQYSINNQPLNETEILQLKSAIQVMSRFKGAPQFDWVHEIIPNIEAKLGLVKTTNEIISFDSNIDYQGREYITPIFSAISNKKTIKVIYKDFKTLNPYELEFHPHYLKQYNNRWFAFGRHHEKESIWTLALDRIQSIDEISTPYIESETNWDDYFSDFIGVTKQNGEVEEIKIKILDAEQAAYIETKPLHESQKPIRETENGFEASIKVIPNYELEKLILSYGDRIQILSPDSVRSRIAERVKNLASLYS